MACINAKSTKRLLVTLERQLGRLPTLKELARVLVGDNSVLKKKIQ